MHGEPKTGEAEVTDVRRADLRVRRFTVEHDAGARAVGHPTHPRVIGVQQRDAVRGQRVDELGLALHDRVDARGASEVHRDLRDRRDDADPLANETREVGDLTRNVEAKLDHGDVVGRLLAQEGERDADLVVVRGDRPQDPVPRAERRRGGLLRGGLADAAGDADRGDGMLVPDRVSGRAERPDGARHLHEDGVVRKARHEVLDDRRARAPGEGVSDEVVAVTLVAQGEETLPTLDEPGIERASDEPQRRVRAAAHDPPAGRREESFEREQRRRCYGPADPYGLRSGWIRAYRRMSWATPLNASVAVRVPSSRESGFSRTTSTTYFGSSAGKKPANELT